MADVKAQQPGLIARLALEHTSSGESVAEQPLEPTTPQLSWTTDHSLSDSTLSPEQTDRSSFDASPCPPEATKYLTQHAREGRSVRFSGVHERSSGSPDRLEGRSSGRSIRAWQGNRCPALTALHPAATATAALAHERATASAPAQTQGLGEHHHSLPPGLPISIPENGSADVPAMPRVRSAASMAGLPPIRKTYPSMELRLDVQARPNSAPAATAWLPKPPRGSPKGSPAGNNSPDSTVSGSSGASGSWLRLDHGGAMTLSPFSTAPPPTEQVNPWSGSPTHSAASSPRPCTPETAKQRGGSAALDALQGPFTLGDPAGEVQAALDTKRRGSSAALDALRSSEACSASEDSITRNLQRRWSSIRDRASKSLVRQRSAGPDGLAPPTPVAMSLRSLWRCSADPALASGHQVEE